MTPSHSDDDDEQRRLEALRRMSVLDSPPDPAFDRLTRLARNIFDVPIALVSLVDERRQWFKSKVGVDVTETPRSWAFCGYTIQSAGIMEVLDARKDRRFTENPLVLGAPFIRYYAGMPLDVGDGLRLGTLCVIDILPRPPLNTPEREILEDLGALVVDEILRGPER